VGGGLSWLEAHQSLRDHPKRDRLSELLFVGTVPDDVADLASIGVLLNLWWWAIDYARDGDLSKFSDLQVAKGCGYAGDPVLLVQALTDAGFIDKKPRRIHDWDEYGGTLIARRQRDAERKREVRKSAVRGTSAGHPRDGVSTDLPTYLKSFASQKTGQAPVDNSKLPMCATCGSQMQYNGDGSDRVHCTVCEPAAATP